MCPILTNYLLNRSTVHSNNQNFTNLSDFHCFNSIEVSKGLRRGSRGLLGACEDGFRDFVEKYLGVSTLFPETT